VCRRATVLGACCFVFYYNFYELEEGLLGFRVQRGLGGLLQRGHFLFFLLRISDNGLRFPLPLSRAGRSPLRIVRFVAYVMPAVLRVFLWLVLRVVRIAVRVIAFRRYGRAWGTGSILTPTFSFELNRRCVVNSYRFLLTVSADRFALFCFEASGNGVGHRATRAFVFVGRH
jgi:hypothetical protein